MAQTAAGLLRVMLNERDRAPAGAEMCVPAAEHPCVTCWRVSSLEERTLDLVADMLSGWLFYRTRPRGRAARARLRDLAKDVGRARAVGVSPTAKAIGHDELD